MMDNNQEAKMSAIKAFLNEADTRVGFLQKVADTGHKPEAMTLCLVYIDRFAQYLCWPQTSAGRNFVDALVQFGGNPLMQLAHPLQPNSGQIALQAVWRFKFPSSILNLTGTKLSRITLYEPTPWAGDFPG